jgi:hypothetical protein
MELARIQKGANFGGDSGNPVNRQPEWMDIEKFKRGQNFFLKHVASFVMALHCSLTVGFAINRLLDALVFNKASDTPKKARRRYFETLVHVILWHTTDVWDSNTPSIGHRSLAFVRRMHCRIAKAMNGGEQLEGFADKKVHNADFILLLCLVYFDLKCCLFCYLAE